MTKELDALQEIGDYVINSDLGDCIAKNTDEYEILESAHKDFDDIKDICNSYNIEFNLPNIREALFTFAQLKGEYGTNWNNYNKKLKALEIIKEKGVDILKLKECKRCKKPDEYNKRTSYSYHKMLTQEEFDLLKEVLL